MMHYDLVGFIPETQRWFNLCTLMNVIHYVNRLKDKKSHDHLITYRKGLWQKSNIPS